MIEPLFDVFSANNDMSFRSKCVILDLTQALTFQQRKYKIWV